MLIVDYVDLKHDNDAQHEDIFLHFNLINIFASAFCTN